MTKKRLSHDAEKMRLQKFLSLAGVASRRHAEEMIRAGRVKISGRVVTEMGVLVHPTKSKVEVDNKAVIFQEERNYILFHKPAGCITSLDDPEGRTTVIDLLPKSLPRVYPVGRLDYDSEGLLLLTNDGELAYKLSHPGSNVPRVYHVKVRGELKDGSAVLERLKTGLELEDGFVKADRVAVLSFTGNNTWLEIELHIGRNRIVRRMMEEVNFPVMKLRRVSFGNLSLDGLPLGGFRDLSETELRETYKQLGETGPLPERRGKDGIRFARGFSPKDREHPRQSAHNMRHDEERPKRTFERGENSEFSSREERPRRRFTEDERPKRRFERKERSEFSTQEEAPRRINDGDERSRRTFERSDRRTSEFSSRDERPRRQNDGDERPRRTFERSDRRTSEFSSRD
ncbi:MAG: pseudouridine synthase, partial [Bradymonadales bacterium]